MGHKNPFLKILFYTLILTVFWDALVGLFPTLMISFIHRWGRNDVDFYSQSDVSFWYCQLSFREDTSVKLFPWDPAELMSAFNTRCWGGDFRRLLEFSGDSRLWSRCEWILWVDPVSGSLSWKPMCIGFILLLRFGRMPCSLFSFCCLWKNQREGFLERKAKSGKCNYFSLCKEHRWNRRYSVGIC